MACARELRTMLLSRSASGFVFVAVCLCISYLMLWPTRLVQDHLAIVNDDGSTDSLKYQDCSHIETKWGGFVSSHGIRSAATFVLEPNNGEKRADMIDFYILRPQCEVRTTKTEPAAAAAAAATGTNGSTEGSKSNTPTPSVASSSKHVATVYVSSQYLAHFADIAHHMSFDFVLLSGGEDTSVPQDTPGFRTLLHCPHVLAWYTQNLGLSAEELDQKAARDDAFKKLHNMPIGLDLHTLHYRATAVAHWGAAASPTEQLQQLAAVRRSAPPVAARKLQLFSNFHFNTPKRHWLPYSLGGPHSSTFDTDRAEALSALQARPDVSFFQEERMPREDVWKAMAMYAFVASPHGHGLDCHRTWEALAVGSIPVVRSSALDAMWEGLPVLVVNRWDDVTLDLLTRTRNEFAANPSLFAEERLTLKYWVEKVSTIPLPPPPSQSTIVEQ